MMNLEVLGEMEEPQREVLARLQNKNSLQSIEALIESFQLLHVTVVGEPIVDTYIFCEPAGISSKSPTISVRTLNQEDYTGGSLAIANLLASLGCRVDLAITHGGENYFRELISKNLLPQINVVDLVIPQIPTPRKIRYLIPLKLQKVFEILDLKENQWDYSDPTSFSQKIYDLSANSDITLVADFGHGMIEREVLTSLQNLPNFLSLNVQTNSGNLGFNPFTKHKRFDYLSIDERECRIALHDRFTPIVPLSIKAVEESIIKPTSITLGTMGSVYFDQSQTPHLCPSFFKEVTDTTGAGDAYLAITSLLIQKDLDPLLIPFLGNCFAGLKSRIIGNKRPVAKSDLIQLIRQLWVR